MPSFKTNMDFVPVSTEFIEKYMVRANGSYVKVYLYASYLAAKNEGAEQAEIASSLNLLESDVKNAFDYWKDTGQCRGWAGYACAGRSMRNRCHV